MQILYALDGITQVSMAEILTYEEIRKVCILAAELGIQKIKITGGEPLVRKGCADLIGNVKKYFRESHRSR